MKHPKLPLVTRCCDQIATAEELEDMYTSEREIGYKTFSKHVDTAKLSGTLGYAHGRQAKGLRLAKDWSVSFYRAVFRGKPCYYMDWSRIDHIFMDPSDARELGFLS